MEKTSSIRQEAFEGSANLAAQRKTSFFGDVLRLVSGTAFAQGIAVLASPFLARLYLPEAFGVLALFTSITSIIVVIACMRYQLAIMLPKDDKEAANLLGLSLLSVVVVTALTVLVVWWGKSTILDWLNAPALGPYVWLMPLMVFVGGIFLALNHWNSRTKHFTRLSIAKVTNSASTLSLQLGVGYAGYATGGTLIRANMAGQAIATTVLGGQIWRDNKKLLLGSINWKDMLSGLKRHKKFPLFSSWSALLNTASWQLPVILLSVFFSPVIAGYYSLGFRVLRSPMSFIGASIGQVFFQRATAAKHDGTLAPLVEKTFRSLVIISFFPMLMLTVIGKDLFVFVFGHNWAEAGVYTQILSMWIFFWFISSPLTSIFATLERLGLGLIVQLTLFASRVITLVIGGLFHNIYFALGLYAASGIIVYGGLVVWNLKLAGVNLKSNLIMLFRYMLYCIPPIAFLYLLDIFNIKPFWIICMAVIELVFYYLIILRVNPQLLQFLKKRS